MDTNQPLRGLSIAYDDERRNRLHAVPTGETWGFIDVHFYDVHLILQIIGQLVDAVVPQLSLLDEKRLQALEQSTTQTNALDTNAGAPIAASAPLENSRKNSAFRA